MSTDEEIKKSVDAAMGKTARTKEPQIDSEKAGASAGVGAGAGAGADAASAGSGEAGAPERGVDTHHLNAIGMLPEDDKGMEKQSRKAGKPIPTMFEVVRQPKLAEAKTTTRSMPESATSARSTAVGTEGTSAMPAEPSTRPQHKPKEILHAPAEVAPSCLGKQSLVTGLIRALPGKLPANISIKKAACKGLNRQPIND
jgi:hypothetical protein